MDAVRELAPPVLGRRPDDHPVTVMTIVVDVQRRRSSSSATRLTSMTVCGMSTTIEYRVPSSRRRTRTGRGPDSGLLLTGRHAAGAGARAGGSTDPGGGVVSTDVGGTRVRRRRTRLTTSISVPGDGDGRHRRGAVDHPPSRPPSTRSSARQWRSSWTARDGPTNPIVIDFSIDASILAAAGVTEATVQLLRNGVPVEACTGAPGTASPTRASRRERGCRRHPTRSSTRSCG